MSDEKTQVSGVVATVIVKVKVTLNWEPTLTDDKPLSELREEAGRLVSDRVQKALMNSDRDLKLGRALVDLEQVKEIALL